MERHNGKQRWLYGTGSGLTRAIHCPASVVLEPLYLDREESDAQRRGNDGHFWAEWFLMGGLVAKPTIGQFTEEDATRLETFINKLSMHQWPLIQTEMAMALKPSTLEVRELGVPGPREYKQSIGKGWQEWIPGTADVVSYDATRKTGIVGDWKFGRGDVAHPSENYQMLFYGYCIAKLYGLKRVKLQIYRLPPDQEPWVESYDMGQADFKAFEETIQDFAREVDRLRKHPPLARDAVWDKDPAQCRYCKAFTRCPAQHDLLRRATGDSFQSEKDLAKAQGQLIRLERLAQELKKELRTNIIKAGGSIEMPSGKKYGPKRQFRKKVKPDAIQAIFEPEKLAPFASPSAADLLRLALDQTGNEKEAKAIVKSCVESVPYEVWREFNG